MWPCRGTGDHDYAVGPYTAICNRCDKITVLTPTADAPTETGWPSYRVALRSDLADDDPFNAPLDDIVVHDVSTFHAEQKAEGDWWVCCHLGDDRIVFRASTPNGPLHWTVSETPADVVYEHELDTP